MQTLYFLHNAETMRKTPCSARSASALSLLRRPMNAKLWGHIQKRKSPVVWCMWERKVQELSGLNLCNSYENCQELMTGGVLFIHFTLGKERKGSFWCWGLTLWAHQDSGSFEALLQLYICRVSSVQCLPYWFLLDCMGLLKFSFKSILVSVQDHSRFSLLFTPMSTLTIQLHSQVFHQQMVKL